MSIRVVRSIAVLGVGALWACSKGKPSVDSMALADSAARAAAATPTPAPAPPPLTDPNIFALLDEANADDSTLGHLASTKATVVMVKTFGRDMMRDHHALRKGGQELAKKLNVTPAPPANDTMPAAAQRATQNLTTMPKGHDWDKAYITNEIATHQAVLSMLQAAQGAATDTALKAAITKAIPTIESHLKKAQEIETKLGGATTMPAESGMMKPETSKKVDTGKKR